MSSTYDAFDIDETSSVARPEKPLWKLIQDKASDDEIHKWCQGELSYLDQENRERLRVIQRNLARYKGLQYLSQEIRERIRDLGDEVNARKVQKIVANHVYDLVQNKVSRLIKYRPAVAILPTNDEFADKIGAKLTKALLDHLWYVQNFEGDIQPEFVKYVQTMGECYLAIEWDPDAGDMNDEFKDKYHDSYLKGEEIILKDDEGNPELDKDGKPIKIEKPVYNGDVVYDTWLTLDVRCERKRRWDDVNYMFVRDVMDVWEARVKYPGNETKLTEEDNAQVYDYEKMQMQVLRGKVVIWKLFHKRTPVLKNGREIVFTSRGIISNKDYPYKHDNLPCTRLTDIDVPGELNGRSFIENVAGLVGAYNNLTNMTVENLVMCGRPKWAFPSGSVRKEQLGNAITLLEFKGPVPPQLIAMNPTPPESYQFRAQLKEEFQQIAGIYGVSRGEPPPGIKAGVALQFLSEQENERNNESVLKYNEWLRQTAIMTLAVAGQYYDEDEDRMIRIIGKNNKWMSMFFKVQHLHKDYDIRVQNSSALPNSKAARLQTLLDLNQQFPEKVTGEQVLDMIDLAQDEKFMDLTTKSIRAAEAENEQILEAEGTPLGDDINDPQKFEDHISHWKVHVGQMRDWGFKNQTPPEVQKRLEDHVLAHELLMAQIAQENPLYMQKLQTVEGYPIFYKIAQISPPPASNTEALPPEMPPAPGGPIEPALELPVQVPGSPVVPENVPSMDAQALQVEAGNATPIEPTGSI